MTLKQKKLIITNSNTDIIVVMNTRAKIDK